MLKIPVMFGVEGFPSNKNKWRSQFEFIFNENAQDSYIFWNFFFASTIMDKRNVYNHGYIFVRNQFYSIVVC